MVYRTNHRQETSVLFCDTDLFLRNSSGLLLLLCTLSQRTRKKQYIVSKLQLATQRLPPETLENFNSTDKDTHFLLVSVEISGVNLFKYILKIFSEFQRKYLIITNFDFKPKNNSHIAENLFCSTYDKIYEQ